MITLTSNLKIGDKTYTPCTVKGNKILLECSHKYGIYYTDVKRTIIERTVSNKGTIRLEGQLIYVLNCPGVALHLGMEK